MSRRSTLLAMTLGFAAIGAATIPALALTSAHIGNLSAHPLSPSMGTNAATSSHPATGGFLGVPPPHQIESTRGSGGRPVSGIAKTPTPVIAPKPATSGTHPIGQTLNKPPHKILPPPPLYTGGVDNVCPFNKLKCPPSGPGSAGNPPTGPGTAGNPPTGSQGPSFPFPSLPDGQGDPSGSTGPVVVVAPPAAGETPVPVTGNAEPCNCLTKQYLDDGSVLFRDICTKEAAIAPPPAEVKAQAARTDR
jgi:hypothetical protein